MPQLLSPFLSGCGHAGRLALENNTATNGDVQVSLGTLLPILRDVQSGVRLLHHVVSLFPPLEETLRRVPRQMGHFTFSPTPARGSNASRSSPTQVVWRCLGFGFFWLLLLIGAVLRVWHAMSLFFDLFSVMITGAEPILRSLVAIAYLRRNVSSSVLPVVSLGSLFSLLLWIVEFFTSSRFESLNRHRNCKSFSPLCRFPFPQVDCFSWGPTVCKLQMAPVF